MVEKERKITNKQEMCGGKGVELDIPITSIVLKSKDPKGKDVIIKLRKVSRNGNVDLLAVDGKTGKTVILHSFPKEAPAMLMASLPYAPKDRGKRIEGAIKVYFSKFLHSLWGKAFDELNYPFVRVSRNPVGRIRVTLIVPYNHVEKIWGDIEKRGRRETYSIHRITDPNADDWGRILYHWGMHASYEFPFLLRRTIRRDGRKDPRRKIIALQRINTAADAVKKAKEEAFKIHRGGKEYIPALEDAIARFRSASNPEIRPIFMLAAQYLEHSKYILSNTPKKYRREAMRDIVTRMALLEHYLRKAAKIISADKW